MNNTLSASALDMNRRLVENRLLDTIARISRQCADIPSVPLVRLREAVSNIATAQDALSEYEDWTGLETLSGLYFELKTDLEKLREHLAACVKAAETGAPSAS